MIRHRYVLLGLLLTLAVGALARELGFAEFQVVQESLSRVHPRMRARWLNERGLEMPGINAPMPVAPLISESTSLRLVGKYGRGPSVEVTGRDSLVFLSLGSEVAIINFADTANPQVLAEVQAMGLVTQAALRDSFLYIGCNAGQAGIEVWNVHDPTAPAFRSRTPTLLSDFCIRDSLLYLTQSLSGPNDTFKIYSIANPENVYLLGSCRDSGNAVTVTNNTAFLADRWGLYSIDVTDPRNPHHVGTYPGMPISVEGRGSICCVSFGNPNQPEWLRFAVLDVTNPASPAVLGSIDSCGGYDIRLDDTLAFISGYYTGGHEFQIVSVADSTSPARVGGCSTPGYGYGVWSCLPRQRAFVADWDEGLGLIDVSVAGSPRRTGAILTAGLAQDVSVPGDIAYVASTTAGLKIIDVSNPALPVEISAVDTAAYVYATSAVARDSYAYTDWIGHQLLAVNVRDPDQPEKTGTCEMFGRAQDMVLRDSLLYCAEDDRFQVVNIARPRQPVVVGTLALPDYAYGMCLRDSLAYVSTYPLEIISVANPAAPRVVGSIPRGSWNTDVQDTLAFVAGGRGLFTYSVADPAAPYELDSLGFNSNTFDVVVVDTLAFVSTRAALFLVNVANPRDPVVLGQHSLPSVGWRVEYAAPFVYVATQDAGICIFETTSAGVAEAAKQSRPRSSIRLAPNPARNWVDIILTSPLVSPCRLSLIDVTGREVASVRTTSGPSHERRTRIELRHLAPGLYFLRAGMEGWSGVLKLVKQ